MRKMQKQAEASQRYENFVEYSSSNDERTEKASQSDEGSSWDIPIRTRQRFPRDQLKVLENLYASNKRPSYEEKERLATKFGTSIKRIQIWFQNRRAKDKKDPEEQIAAGKASPSTSQTSSPQDTNYSTSTVTTTTTVSTQPESTTVNPIHITARSPEKRSRYQKTAVPRRYSPQERYPVHYPTGATMHNTVGAAAAAPPFYYHHPYYTPEFWHPKYRVGSPHIVNQSRSAPIDPQQLQQQQQPPYPVSRVTRSQAKKRKV